MPSQTASNPKARRKAKPNNVRSRSGSVEGDGSPSAKWSGGWRALCLCTLSGCCWFLACTPYNLWLLAWIAMIPALFVLDYVPTARKAAFFCWVAGAASTGGGYYWLIELMRRFGELPWPAAFLIFALFCAYQGTIFLFFGVAVHYIRQRTHFPMVVLAPVVMVTFELIVPLIFPSYLAIVLAGHPLAIQIADLAGPLGVTALLLVVNGAAYDVLRDRRKGLRPALAAVVIVAAVLLYGFVRMRQFDAAIAAAPKLAVGVVQPNVPYDQKGVKHPQLAISQLNDLQEQSRQLERAGAQLIVWSESAYPFALPTLLKADYPEADSRHILRGFSTPTVVGALAQSPDGADLYNSAWLFDRDGRVAGRYDKMRLLAFGEHIPAVDTFPWLRDLVPPGFGVFTPGKEAVALPLATGAGEVRLGAVICYEDILPGFLRQVGEQHPHLLVNLTNDTWFGEKTEPWEHLALATFATIEQRTALVRAVNSGVSAFIDPNGRVFQKTYAVDPYIHPHPATSSLATVPLMEGGHTVFARVGNLFAYLCVAVTLLLLVKAARTTNLPADI